MATSVKLVVDENFLGCSQFTPTPSSSWLSQKVLRLVRPVRFGETETVIEPEMTVIVAEAVLSYRPPTFTSHGRGRHRRRSGIGDRSG
jgi:hypothetical protein